METIKAKRTGPVSFQSNEDVINNDLDKLRNHLNAGQLSVSLVSQRYHENFKKLLKAWNQDQLKPARTKWDIEAAQIELNRIRPRLIPDSIASMLLTNQLCRTVIRELGNSLNPSPSQTKSKLIQVINQNT